ncbi:hypothetical protein GGH96_003418 [Coemansia sp. RSA 1972]|nr:hypothetical protein GGH96_003418 [Coemansia sp. RSA 1972]
MSQNIPIDGNSKKQEAGIQFAAPNASRGGHTPGGDSGSLYNPGIEAPPNSLANQQSLPMQVRQGFGSAQMLSGSGPFYTRPGTDAPPNSFANQQALPMQGRPGFSSSGTDAPPNSFSAQHLGIPMQGRQSFGGAGTDAPPNSFANQQSIGGAMGISNSFLDRKLRGMDIVHERDENADDGDDDEMSGASPSSRSANRQPYNDSGDIFEMD